MPGVAARAANLYNIRRGIGRTRGGHRNRLTLDSGKHRGIYRATAAQHVESRGAQTGWLSLCCVLSGIAPPSSSQSCNGVSVAASRGPTLLFVRRTMEANATAVAATAPRRQSINSALIFSSDASGRTSGTSRAARRHAFSAARHDPSRYHRTPNLATRNPGPALRPHL